MKQYIDKADIKAEIERLKECNHKICGGDFDFLKKVYPEHYYSTKIYDEILSFLDTLEVKEVDLSDGKPDWHPSKKQIESLGALVRYNIGVFDYQKLNEVALLYDDLTKILDNETDTDRQK